MSQNQGDGVERMHGWVGRKDRRSVDTDALVRRDDGTEFPVKLIDFSDEGCRIETGGEVLRIGEWISLAVASADVKAQVRWALGTSAGLKFEAPETAKEE